MSKALPLEQIPVIDKDHQDYKNIDTAAGAVILVDKGMDWSSFHAVKLVRNRIGIKKVGHAGTLDPLATGLLIICAGKATKSIEQIQTMPKTYVAEVTFGASTPSLDLGTEFDATADCAHITQEIIQKTLDEQFSGEIEQIPPMFSALKKDGQRLYKLARKGEEVERKARKVEIYSSRIIAYKAPVLELEVKCSKGTYVRTLADDLGKAMNSLAHLSGLRRTEIGPYSVEKAFTVEHIKENWQS